ncbi:MAG: DUF308 domain-containing protein [Micromonosporaceae bacterium]
MTDRPLRRGRRDNGLQAAQYAPATDVDPRLGEHLLEVLGVAGIAAYLQPSSDLDPVTRSTWMPARPTDRLYVDSEHLSEAREYARRLETGDSLQDEDAEEGGQLDDLEVKWRELVTRLEADRSDAAEAGAATESGAAPADTTPSREPDFSLPRIRNALPVAGADEPTLLDALDADLGDDDDEGFVPPPPPPLPQLSRHTGISLALLAAGVLVLVWPQVLAYINIRSTEAVLVIATALLVAGGIGLILRLRPAPDPDSDPDDGAKV